MGYEWVNVMRPSELDQDTRGLLDEIQRENDMRMAYIAGVGKGIDLMMGDKQMMKSDFNQFVRESFREFLGEYDDWMD